MLHADKELGVARVAARRECDCCRRRLGLRIFHYEGKRYCSHGCLEAGAMVELRRPLFEARPFPPGMAGLKARIR